MKTDRELLELAAKAAGIDYHIDNLDGTPKLISNAYGAVWNPLCDDGAAIRLAVNLGFTVEPGECWHSPYGPAFGEDVLDGVMKATRRAIVRAAAEIGKAMR